MGNLQSKIDGPNVYEIVRVNALSYHPSIQISVEYYNSIVRGYSSVNGINTSKDSLFMRALNHKLESMSKCTFIVNDQFYIAYIGAYIHIAIYANLLSADEKPDKQIVEFIKQYNDNAAKSNNEQMLKLPTILNSE